MEIKIQSIERRTREELDELAKNNPGRGPSTTGSRTVHHGLADRPPLTQKQKRELHKNNSNFQSMDLLNRWTD
jgi:hypothetical protein